MNIYFYDDSGNIYNNHIDAIKSKKECFLYYEDHFYDNVTWKIEPSLSLRELYKLRAQEIRDSYEYVILFLSGGVDSRNVFESFYFNDIHMDEIICFGSFSQDEFRGSTQNNNDEIFKNTSPLLNNVFLPNTKITYFDYTNLFTQSYNFELIKNFGNEWAYELPYYKSFYNFFWYEINKHLNIKKDKKTCYILGAGKSILGVDNIGAFTLFPEREILNYSARYKVDNLYRENFYFAPTSIGAEIVKKQCFSMYDCYQKMPDKKMFYDNYFDAYSTIVYDLKFPLLVKTRKTSYSFFSHRDSFMQNHTNSEIYKIWNEGLQKLSADIGLNYAPHYSKKYYIT